MTNLIQKIGSSIRSATGKVATSLLVGAFAYGCGNSMGQKVEEVNKLLEKSDSLSVLFDTYRDSLYIAEERMVYDLQNLNGTWKGVTTRFKEESSRYLQKTREIANEDEKILDQIKIIKDSL